jgi:tetrapyrrole methylase family protein/MazG family protein
MAKLRGPDGCPWDREQTMGSLRPFILEEAYELVEAIGQGRTQAVREELGDLLLEVVFVNQIAEEDRSFTMSDVVRGIHDKLVRRHPHVFESEPAESADHALERWEDVKAREKPERGSLLDGVPHAMPALSRAYKLSKRAAQAGFDWTSVSEVMQKVTEELTELWQAIDAGDPASVQEEVGDLLFAITNLARHLDLDAERALGDANRKFSERFRFLEARLKASGKTVEGSELEELEALWREAKQQGSGSS